MKKIDELVYRIWKCVKKAIPKAAHTSLWLIKIIVPIALIVRLMQYYGILDKISEFLKPLFSVIGLPGETSIVFITSMFSPLYAPIALITSMSLSVREASILALMCLITHNLPVESAVQAKTGSAFWNMSFLRVLMSFIVALSLNAILPSEGWSRIGTAESASACANIKEVISLWFGSSMKLVITLIVIVTALMILHYVLEEFKLMHKISNLLSPLMKILGLPKETAFLWLVGNVVGLAYGSAIMREQIEQKNITTSQGNLLNHHLAVSHSLLEDTIIFAMIGVPALLLITVRLGFAMIVVWGKRGFDYFYSRKLKQIYE